MGHTTYKNTKRIYKSLLALGIIESGYNPITRGIIIDLLNDLKVEAYSEAGRILDLSKTWLKKENEEYYSEVVVGREKTLSIDFSRVPESTYLDFIDTLLSLYRIGEREADEAIVQIYRKQGIKPLSLITKLILAIESNDIVRLYIQDGVTLNIKPSGLKREANAWVVEGVRVGDPQTLKTTIPLHQINEIEF